MAGFMRWACGKEKIRKNNINRESTKYKFEISCTKDTKYTQVQEMFKKRVHYVQSIQQGHVFINKCYSEIL